MRLRSRSRLDMREGGVRGGQFWDSNDDGHGGQDGGNNWIHNV